MCALVTSAILKYCIDAYVLRGTYFSREKNASRVNHITRARDATSNYALECIVLRRSLEWSTKAKVYVASGR